MRGVLAIVLIAHSDFGFFLVSRSDVYTRTSQRPGRQQTTRRHRLRAQNAARSPPEGLGVVWGVSPGKRPQIDAEGLRCGSPALAAVTRPGGVRAQYALGWPNADQGRATGPTDGSAHSMQIRICGVARPCRRLAVRPGPHKGAYIRRCATARDRAALTGSWLRLGTPQRGRACSPPLVLLRPVRGLRRDPAAPSGPTRPDARRAPRRGGKLGGRPLIGCGSLILPNPLDAIASRGCLPARGG